MTVTQHHTDHTHTKINTFFFPIPLGEGAVGGVVRCMLSKSPAALVKPVEKIKKGLLVHPSTHPCPKLR